MPKSTDILDKVISQDAEIAELREELAEAEAEGEKLDEKFQDAIDRESQTAEIIDAVTASDEVQDADALEELHEEIAEETATELEGMKTWLMETLAPLGQAMDGFSERLSRMEEMMQSKMPPETEAGMEEAPASSIPQASEEGTNSSETRTETSDLPPMENPAESVADALDQAGQEAAAAPAKAVREIVKL